MPKCDFNKVAKQEVGFGFALNGAMNNHNVRMYAPSNQPPNFYYNVDGSCQKLLFGEDYVETALCWVLSSLTEMLMGKVI